MSGRCPLKEKDELRAATNKLGIFDKSVIKKATIVGSGLAGPLLSIFLAKKYNIIDSRNYMAKLSNINQSLFV